MSVRKESKYIFKKLRSSYKFLCELLQDIDDLQPEDELREIRAVTIATHLRTLLYDSKQSISILSQLGIKDKLFFMPTCADGQIDIACNLAPSYMLVDCQISGDNLYVSYKRPKVFSHRLNIFFNHWWREIVIDTKGDNPVRLSRGRVITTLCDKEGGAHLDPEFTDDYYEVNYNFGYRIVKNDGEECELKNNVFAETTIAIAYEVLDAIAVFFNNVQNKPLVIEDTPFNIIAISYPNTIGEHDVRFYLNSRRNLYLSSRLAFDYYNKAAYSICNLKGYKYSREDGSFFSFLTVEENGAKQMIVLRDDESQTYEVIQEVSGGIYSKINHDNDSLEGEEMKLQELILSLSKDSAKCFDKYLGLQIV